MGVRKLDSLKHAFSPFSSFLENENRTIFWLRRVWVVGERGVYWKGALWYILTIYN